MNNHPTNHESNNNVPSVREIARGHAEAAGRLMLVRWLDTGSVPSGRQPYEFDLIGEALDHVQKLSERDSLDRSKTIFQWNVGGAAVSVATDIRLLTTGTQELGTPSIIHTDKENPGEALYTWLIPTTAGAILEETNNGFVQSVSVLSVNSPEAVQIAINSGPQHPSA